jgi:hypothetical protein
MGMKEHWKQPKPECKALAAAAGVVTALVLHPDQLGSSKPWQFTTGGLWPIAALLWGV